MLFVTTELLLRSGSTKTTSTLSKLNPGVGLVLTSSTALLKSIVILSTNDYISKFKKNYTKLKDWIHIFTLLYGETLKESMVDKKIDEKEALESKKIFNHHLDKKSNIVKSIRFRVHDNFGDIRSKVPISSEQKTKPNSFSPKYYEY